MAEDNRPADEIPRDGTRSDDATGEAYRPFTCMLIAVTVLLASVMLVLLVAYLLTGVIFADRFSR